MVVGIRWSQRLRGPTVFIERLKLALREGLTGRCASLLRQLSGD